MKELVSILICGILLCGCKGETGPVGPISTGTIAGTVKLNNAQGNDNSGVTIALDGTSYSATSTSDGKWEITNVPAGVYKTVFSKSGYFTQEFFNFQFVGNGTYYFYNYTLGEVPSQSVTQLYAQAIDTTGSILFTGLISPAVQTQQTVFVLISTSPLTRSIPIEAFDILAFGASDGQYEFTIYYNHWYYQNITSGDTLYAISYLGDAQYSGISLNPITNLYVFNTPGVHLSNVVSVVVP